MADAPLVVLALYLLAESLVATLVVGRPAMLVVAAPIALAGAAAIARRRSR